MRVLHTMIRVGDWIEPRAARQGRRGCGFGDLDRSIRFYTDVLGMQLLRRQDYPDGKFTLAFDGRRPWRPPFGRTACAQFRSRRNCVGYGSESEQAVIELTYNYGVDRYELGTGFGHIALAVEDARRACEEIKKRGGKVVREAGPMKHGTTVIAFAEDPDGYRIELIQAGSRKS